MSGAITAATVAVGAYNAYQGRKAASAQKKASSQAAAAQIDATDKQIQFLRESERRADRRLRPFVEFGRAGIGALSDMLTPEGQYGYLDSNPMFQAAVDYTGDQLKASGAAAGRFNSGGTVDQLFKNYLATGETFIGNQFNRLLTPVQIGQSSAAGQAANIMNTGQNVAGIYGNQGDVLAANMINRANINNQQSQQNMNMLSGALMGGIGTNAMNSAIGGGGWQGALLGGMMACDERLKENIERVGETDDGIPLYKFNYKGDGHVFFGPMAQEVEQVKPWAVMTHESGYKMVNSEEI